MKSACLFATKSDIDELDFGKSVCYAFVCKEALFSFEDVPSSLPPAVTNILQEFSDVFPQDVPPGLPPIRGIEHQIDLIPGASLPNHAPYRTNPEETKEIMRQVQEHYFHSRTCLPLCLLLSLTFYRSLLTSFHKTCHRDYRLFEGLSIRLT